MAEIGGSLTLGSYEVERLPTTSVQQMLNHGVYVLGRSNARLISAAQRAVVRQCAGLGGGAQVTSFTRAFLSGETIMGTTYKRSQARINHVVVHRVAGQAAFFQVHSFHLVQHGVHALLIALGRPIQRAPQQFAPGNAIVTANHLAHTNAAFYKVVPIP